MNKDVIDLCLELDNKLKNEVDAIVERYYGVYCEVNEYGYQPGDLIGVSYTDWGDETRLHATYADRDGDHFEICFPLHYMWTPNWEEGEKAKERGIFPV